ncbi:MAG: 23S rRNA (pseudouridine(1915)-N(3))-methyltransferase RlmH [Bryobacteraceae bacterium]
MKIWLYYVGKPRHAHANALAEEYVKRAGRYVRCEIAEIHVSRSRWWEKHASAWKVLLDPGGERLDSAGFARLVGQAEMQGKDLVFVVGGADGLPEAWRAHADRFLSLTPLTLPHELARVVLAEQIYRALASLRGHPYPR